MSGMQTTGCPASTRCWPLWHCGIFSWWPRFEPLLYQESLDNGTLLEKVMSRSMGRPVGPSGMHN